MFGKYTIKPILIILFWIKIDFFQTGPKWILKNSKKFEGPI